MPETIKNSLKVLKSIETYNICVENPDAFRKCQQSTERQKLERHFLNDQFLWFQLKLKSASCNDRLATDFAKGRFQLNPKEVGDKNESIYDNTWLLNLFRKFCSMNGVDRRLRHKFLHLMFDQMLILYAVGFV